jgi:hypothetical protein
VGCDPPKAHEPGYKNCVGDPDYIRRIVTGIRNV